VTLATIQGLVSDRLNESAAMGGPTSYPTTEITAAVNEGLRLFATLTLCIEKTAAWAVTPAQTFQHMMLIFADWLAPLRISTATGAKVRPARLSELWALDSAWVASPGPPTRYASMGFDLVALYQQPAAGGTVLTCQYAACPPPLVNAGDVPAIPLEYHEQLVKYGIYRCRQPEGSEPLESVLPLLEEFLAAAQDYAEFVRARNVGAGYDTLPMELALFDRSTLVGSK
jgi:hypothetical protein